MPNSTNEITLQDMSILLSQKLSENVGETAEGYLICHNVPVSRTGVQYYLGQELGLGSKFYNKRIPVYRLAEDVFDPESLKSLESKPVTSDHPIESVTVQNAAYYTKGHGRNARDNGENVIAELVITDPGLIQQIRQKTKYQISLGYTCSYEPYKDGFRQKNIRINHIAVVAEGRAGHKVAIKDSQPKKRKPLMSQKELAGKILAAIARDESFEPQEISKVLDMLQPQVKETKNADAGLLKKLAEMFGKDEEPAKKQEVTMDAISEMVAKAVKDALEKAEEINAEDESEGEKADEEELEEMLKDEEADPVKEDLNDEEAEEAKEAKDAAYKALVKDLKPVIAKMDAKNQKVIKDALVQVKKNGVNGYSAIAKVVQAATKDSAPQKQNLENIGKNIMKKFNPHYNK